MRKHTVVFLATILFLIAPLSSSAAPLQVLSAAPKGTLTQPGRQAVSVSFNQPVVALAQQSQFASSACPLEITPAVAGTCRFSGTQTLLFEPAQDWPQAARFTVKLKENFSSQVTGEKLSAPYTFSFTTLRPAVRLVYPTDNEHWVSATPTLYAGFNMPVNAQEVAPFVYLQDPAGTQLPLAARDITPEEFDKQFSYYPSTQHVLAFSPKQPLRKGVSYTWVFAAGLKGADGSLGSEKEYKTHFVTTPDLSVLGVKKSGCLPFAPQVRFSAPVRLKDLLASAKISPAGAVKKLSPEELDAIGRDVVVTNFMRMSPRARQNLLDEYNLSADEQANGSAFFVTPLSFLDLRPGQNVMVTLDKNLRDIYGGRLGQDYTFTVSNSGYCPAVDFSGGFGVLESYLPARLPVEVINTPSVPLRAAQFNKENYIPFLTQNKSAYCAEKPLKDATYSGPYVFKDVKDKTLKTYFDLSRFKPTAQDSLIFSQVKIKRGTEDCWVSSTDNLTDVGLTFKVSAEDILLWATSLETGEPMANLAVEVRDNTNTILWSGSTDMNGLARAPGWKKLDTKEPSWGTPKLYAFVSSAGGDGFISTELNEGIEPWRFNVEYSYNPQQETWRTFLFTERGIYRPGEKVYITGLVRKNQNKAWALPGNIAGKVTVSDSTGQELFTDTVNLSAGAFNTQFSVPANAHSGYWEVSFTPQPKDEKDLRSTHVYFQVETAKPAEFKVTLQPEKKNYFSGEKAQFVASANYNFGAPIAQAPAKWNLRREMTWFNPEEFKDYTFTPYFLREGEYKEDGKLIHNSSGKTDKNGALMFTAPLPQVNAPATVFAELEVQSPARQNLFARTPITVHPASFYIGAHVMKEYAKAGQPVKADVVAVTVDGKRTQATVQAKVQRKEWRSVRKVGLSGRLEWVSEQEVFDEPGQSFTIAENGSTFSFTPQKSGSYYITFISSDQAGRPVRGGFDVMVYGENGPAWAQQDDDLLKLKQDKNTYRPGQKARISVQSPYQTARALVTVEREGILDAWITSVKGGADYVEVPIKENYLPNVYVSVTLVKGRSSAPVNDKGVDLGKPQGKMGYVNLTVEPESKKIAVRVETNKKEYRPGDEVTVKLSTQVGGKGVAADVMLFVVDEGVLALTDYKTPEPFSEFYQSHALSVFTSDNRPYVIGQRSFGEKGENRGGGGSAEAKLGGVDLRSNFSFVPYVNQHIKTDGKGRAVVKFKLPDNLTRFRIMAIAARTEDFGSGQAQITSAKPLMITSNLPQIARKADKFYCSAVVYNYADKKGHFSVQATSSGVVRLINSQPQEIEVPLGQAQEVSWLCQAAALGTATVDFVVKGGGETDGVRSTIKVLAVEKPQTLSLYNYTTGSQEELLQKPTFIIPDGKNEVKVSLASTALLNVQGALTYLTTYPYDCLEQQMSKIRPVIQSEKLVQDFKLADISALKKQAQEVLDKMPQYQHTSGGFAYWPDALPDPYVTAYALETAYLAKEAGFTVPQKALQQAAAWLEQAFNKNQLHAFSYSVYETDTARSYSVYVLALYKKEVSAAFNNLYARYASLPLPAAAYLLKAASKISKAPAVKQNLAQHLINHLVYTPTKAYFTADARMPWLHISDVFTTALSLDALLRAGQSFHYAAQTVAWLLSQLNAQGHWNSTHENAAVISALQEYVKSYETQTPDFTAQVAVNTQPFITADFKGRSIADRTETFSFQKVYAQKPQARVKITKNGVGTLYYAIGQTYQPRAYSEPVNAGFEVTRRITALDGTPVTELVAGQRYLVSLQIRSAANRHFVVVEDFLPAGVEIVNTSLATQQAAAASQANSDNMLFGRVERYDERIAAFADYIPAGTHTFTYQITAVVRGWFTYPCAWASLLYEPANFGHNATSELIVK